MPSKSVVHRMMRKATGHRGVAESRQPRPPSRVHIITERGSYSATRIETLRFTLPKGLSRASAESMLRAKAKKKGKMDARAITYDPRTGRGTIT